MIYKILNTAVLPLDNVLYNFVVFQEGYTLTKLKEFSVFSYVSILPIFHLTFSKYAKRFLSGFIQLSYLKNFTLPQQFKG